MNPFLCLLRMADPECKKWHKSWSTSGKIFETSRLCFRSKMADIIWVAGMTKHEQGASLSGWPDCANFRPMGDCLLFTLGSFLSYRISPHFCDTVVLIIEYVLILAKIWVGLHFVRFFQKLIWSPWSLSTPLTDTESRVNEGRREKWCNGILNCRACMKLKRRSWLKNSCPTIKGLISTIQSLPKWFAQYEPRGLWTHDLLFLWKS
jgi:hypothetical protein